jgi:hypothetical protein
LQDVLIDRGNYVKTVSERVSMIASELRPRFAVPLEFHNTLQKRVAELGAEFGFRGIREYPVFGNEPGVEGLADVAWLARKRLASVFEIDSEPKEKSVKKLVALDSPFRFWIYYGRPHYLSMVRSVDRAGSVDVIRLHGMYF